MSEFTESVVEQATLAWLEVALGGAADEPGPIAVGHHVRVLVREGEPTAKVVVGTVGDHDLAIAEREPRDVVRKIDEPGSNALRLEQRAHVWHRRMPKAETSTLLFSKPLTMLSRVPAGLRSRERVRGNGREVAIDAHEALEVVSSRPRAMHSRSFSRTVGSPMIAVCARKRAESRTRDAQVLRSVVLRRPASLARRSNSPPELLLSDGHLRPHATSSGACCLALPRASSPTASWPRKQ